MLNLGRRNLRVYRLLVTFILAALMVLPLPALAADMAPDAAPSAGVDKTCEINWPQFHYDEANTGYTQAKAPDTSDLAWESENIGAVEHSQPVVAWTKVFVYCGDSVKALNRFTGEIIWTAPVKERVWDSWSSPAYDRGRVFIGSSDTVYCLSASGGRILWETVLPGGVTVVNSSPTVAEGKVFIGAYKMGSEDTGTYFALDERTGGILWSKTIGDFAQSTPAYAKGKVYVGWADGSFQKGGIACLDASNGAVAWQQETTYGVWGSAATGDGLVYAPTYNFSEPGTGKLYALNKADGNVKWCRDVVSTDATPAIACNRVYLSSGYPSEWTPWLEIKTYCFDARSGEPVWEKQDVGGWTCSPAVADNKVFVGKIKVVDWSSVYEGTYALDAGDGSVIWESPAGGSSPAVVFHKRLYTVGGGKVYAFRSPLLKFEEIAEPAEAQELESSML